MNRFRSVRAVLGAALLTLAGLAAGCSDSSSSPPVVSEPETRAEAPAKKPRPRPSFDCAKGATRSEELICSSETLAALDVKLASAYRAAVKSAGSSGPLKEAQQAWLRERDRCEDEACLKKAYEARITLIEQGKGAAGGEVPKAGEAAGTLSGTYESANGSLKVLQETGGTVRFELVATWQGEAPGAIHTGEAWGRVPITDGAGVYRSEECQISMTFQGDKVTLTQNHDTGNCGFGVNVVADGVYLKKSATPPKMELGG